MNVLVTGGTGFVGRYLCAELVDRGHEVRTMDRTPEPSAVPDAVETVAGDITEYEDVAGAVEGQDAIINLVALSPLFKPKGGNVMHERIHTGGTENCLRAAAEHDVERFVQQSAMDAAVDASTHYLRAKGRAEKLVRESDLDWTIIRPSIIFGEGGEFVSFTMKLTTPYVTGFPGGGRTPFQPIWVEDFVPMLVGCLEDDEHVGQTYEIGGPEVVTIGEVARLGHRANGRSLKIVPIPMALVGAGAKVGDAIPRFPFGVDQYRGLKADNTTDENAIGAFGVEESDLTTLASYLGLDNRQTSSPRAAKSVSN